MSVARRFRFPHLLVALALLASCRAASDAGARQSHDIPLMREDTTFEAAVPRDATLETLLRQQVSDDLASSIVQAVAGVFNPRDLRADQSYQVVRTLDGLFREFRYSIDADNLLRVVLRDRVGEVASSIDVEVVPVPRDYETSAVSAVISPANNSLVAAFDAAGENIQLSLRLADAYSGEVDFNSDLRPGDRIDVLFERAMREGEFVGYGDVDAAVLTTRGRSVTAIPFVGSDGTRGWYDEQGRSLKRAFLKSPLPFDPRVTSGFSFNRFHPVLGVNRPHLGVDYGAPYGTPVNAVGAGTVEAAEWAGEAGRMVRIRHAGGYETAYLHLASFAPGIRPGARVEQGQIIGRVGQSGTATGPHLDYRILKNGVYLNPIAELKKMPPGMSLAADALPAFMRERDNRLRLLATRLAGRIATATMGSTPLVQAVLDR